MARFVWRLQRVLDIRKKEEQTLRSELMVLSERMVVLRQEIMVIRARIRSALEELSYAKPAERLSSQQLFMKYSEYSENEINSLKSELSEVAARRKEKMNEILNIRQAIKALEKLRAKTKKEFLNELAHKEQNELDEYTGNKFGRKAVVGV